MQKFKTFVNENDKKTPFSINGVLPRRLLVKYHKMLELKGSKINFQPKLCLVSCHNVEWLDGDDLYDILEDGLVGLKFDCEVKKFGKFKIGNETIVYLKIEIPQKVKELRQDIFKRIKYVGSDTEKDQTNTPHIEIARFKGEAPKLPSFDPETLRINTLRFNFKGKENIEKTF